MNKSEAMSKEEIFAEADKNTTAAAKAAFEVPTQEEEKQTETAAGEEQAPEQEAIDPTELLAGIPGAPDSAKIEAWKSQYGDVYMLPLDRKEVYVWRPLRNLEYQNLLNSDVGKSDASFQEAIVLRALLYPKLEPAQVANTRAGLMATLFQVIMQGSYFLTPEFALSLVQKL